MSFTPFSPQGFPDLRPREVLCYTRERIQGEVGHVAGISLVLPDLVLDFLPMHRHFPYWEYRLGDNPSIGINSDLQLFNSPHTRLDQIGFGLVHFLR